MIIKSLQLKVVKKMDEETKKSNELLWTELKKQRRFNEGVLKCIEELRETQEKILEIMAGK